MYKLYKLEEDLYEIHSLYDFERAMEGTLLGIMTYAVHSLRFNPIELELALLDMNDKDNDTADFSSKRTFVRSSLSFKQRIG
jgi:hypothetical protein